MATLTIADLDNGKRDLQTVDEVANSQADTTTTRHGAATLTLAGALRRLGYAPPIPYAPGIVVTSALTTVERDGVVYAPLVELLPFTTGVWGPNQWRVLQNDPTLRADLAKPGGSALIGDGAQSLSEALEEIRAESTKIQDPLAPAFLKTTSDILNYQPVSLLRNIPKGEHAAILDGSSTYDVKAAWQELIDALSTGQDTITGGTITLERGMWGISGKVSVRTGHVSGLTSVNIVGDGMHNTYVLALPGFDPGATSMLEMTQPTYCKTEGLHLFAAGRAPRGLHVKSGSEITIRDVFAQNATTDGMLFEDNFMMTLDRLRTKGGVRGMAFDGPHTSISARALYALQSSSVGFDIRDITYSNFTACGSDTNSMGYRIGTCAGLTMQNCGAENNKRSAFGVYASDADNASSQNADGVSLTLDNCISFDNDTGGAGFGGSLYVEQSGTAKVNIDVRRFTELTSASALSGVIVGDPNKIRIVADGESLFTKAFAGSALQSFYRRPMQPVSRTVGFSVGQSVGVADLASLYGNANQYSGLLQVTVSRNAQSSGLSAYVASYLLLVTKGAGTSAATVVTSNGNTSGGTADAPSFTWAVNGGLNALIATAVGSTAGAFSFHISTVAGAMNAV